MSYNRALVYMAMTAFVVSLFLPSVNAMWGVVTVFFGFASILLDPPWFIVWVANPLCTIVAWMILKDRAPVARKIIVAIAMLFAAYGIVAESWVIDDTGQPQIMVISAGYWVWLSSVALMTLAAFAPGGAHSVDQAAASPSA